MINREFINMDKDKIIEIVTKTAEDFGALLGEVSAIYYDLDSMPTITEQEIVDKIRAEFIDQYPKNYMGEPELNGASCVFSLNKVLDIINKHMGEVEP